MKIFQHLAKTGSVRNGRGIMKLHHGLVLYPSCVPEKVDVNQK
jgi:hypothetical protein